MEKRRTILIHIEEEDLCRYVRAGLQSFGFDALVKSNISLENESNSSELNPFLIIHAKSNKILRYSNEFLPANRYQKTSALIIHERDIPNELHSQLCSRYQVCFLKRPFTWEQLGSTLNETGEFRQDSFQVLPDNGDVYLLGESQKMYKVRKLIKKVSRTSLNVIINGETGTGKAAAAQAIHRQSGCINKEFLRLNHNFDTASIPDFLLPKDNWTAANGWELLGLLDLRKVGTLFLEEAADLSQNMQAKLVGMLETNGQGKNGAESEWPRIVAATRTNLSDLAESGSFRADLLYRLNVAQISIPPLRDRLEDIPLLKEYFLEKYSVAYRKPYTRISEKLMELFLTYRWPGNLQELDETVKDIVVRENESHVSEDLYKRCKVDYYRSGEASKIWGLFSQNRASFFRLLHDEEFSLKALGDSYGKAVEAEVIRTLLKENNWNRRACAEMLKISYKALISKIREYNFPEVH